MNFESYDSELIDRNLVTRVEEAARLEEIAELLTDAVDLAGRFVLFPEDIEIMSEINERLGELGL